MDTLKKEVQVALSPRAQPWWFRVIKWSLLIGITARYRHRSWFPRFIGIASIASISLHLFYRWKTEGWQKAWGGWSDVPDRPSPQ